MNICIATYATGEYAPLCDITDSNKKRYADYNGYGFERNHDESFNRGEAYFDRHIWHLNLMKTIPSEWFYFVDADAIFTNFHIKLADVVTSDDNLIFPIDAVMIQAGGFMARNTEKSRLFLEEVVSNKANPHNHGSDQIQMELLMDKYSKFVRIVPQKTMGSYDYRLYIHLGGNYTAGKDRNGNDGQWQPGDFVFHCPGMTMEMKCKTISRVIVESKNFIV